MLLHHCNYIICS